MTKQTLRTKNCKHCDTFDNFSEAFSDFCPLGDKLFLGAPKPFSGGFRMKYVNLFKYDA